MLLISHNREFLDSVTEVPVHIESTKLTCYGGNYSKPEDFALGVWAKGVTLLQDAYTP